MPVHELPLKGMRVLDFAWVWSGPQVAAWLGELGAEVIKVEHGRRLDNTRLRSRPIIDGVQAQGPSIELHPYFHQSNHGKRSITLNLKLPQAQALARELVKTCDVLVENLSPGVMARSGLGYEDAAALNARLVYLSMSALGQTGPQSDLRAYAPVMSSFAGIEAQVGYPGEPPVGMMNFGLGDPNAAVHALVPLLAALWEREESGKGCHIDMAQIEAIVSTLPEPALQVLLGAGLSPARGNRSREKAPHGIFPAAGEDAWVSLAVANDAQWADLGKRIGEPWCAAGQFSTVAGRLANVDELERHLASWTRRHTREELSASLRALGIACTPVLSVAEQWFSGQARERGIYKAVPHPVIGELMLYALPWSSPDMPPNMERCAPTLGQDNDYVFGELLGLSTERIAELKAADVIS